ncbi:MAG: endonuclease/exonuclease/phosphatase family protein [Potamolinea sp.]
MLPNDGSWETTLNNVIYRWLAIGVVASCLFSLIGFMGGGNREAELTSHFRFQYLFIGVFGLIFFYFNTKKNILYLISIFCIVINLTEVAPWYFAPSNLAIPSATPQLRVLLSNVQTSNTNYASVISLVREETPKIAVFLEVNDIWAKKLDSIRTILPYSLVYAREDNFGIAMYSSLPLEKGSLKFFTNEEVASIRANITINRKVVSMIVTHPLPPIKADYFFLRNQQLQAISNYVKQLKNSVIVIGDLNTTMWSPYYKSFVQTSQLHNTRAGFGILSTWPALFPPLSIPIDHCLVSPDIQVVNSRTGKYVGSDHLPLITDLIFPEKTSVLPKNRI